MRKLEVINNKHNINSIHAVDEPGSGNANHIYLVKHGGTSTEIKIQHGGRDIEGSVDGVTSEDLLEIVRDFLTSCQKSRYACAANKVAILNIENALKSLHQRTVSRATKGCLGTNKKGD